MKSQVWTGFTPAASGIENLHGGIMLYDKTGTYDPVATENYYVNDANGEKNRNGLFVNKSTYFMSLSYDLKVSATHDGWHHYVGFYSDRNGPSYSGGVVKLACPAGVYRMFLHFQAPLPKVGSDQGDANLETTLIGQPLSGVTDYLIRGFGVRTNGSHDNIMSFQPLLIAPTQAGTQFKLYDPLQYDAEVGGIGAEGYPISFPENFNPY